VLKLKPNCECCDVDLPTDSAEARMCSFECTFCSLCAEHKFDDICPNCGGELVVRPTRPDKYLKDYPPAADRYVNDKHANRKNIVKL